MPRSRFHCAISRKRTGNDFEELHRWIDEPTRRLGVNHRRRRHYYNRKDQNAIREYWDSKGKGLGEKAVVEWLFHIAIDNLDTAFKMSQKIYGDRTFNIMKLGLSKTGYIHCIFDRADEDKLDSIFKEEYGEEYY